MPMNSFVYATQFTERPNGKLCMYANMRRFVVLWWQSFEKMSLETHMHKTAKSKPTSNKLNNNKLKEKIWFWKWIIFCDNLIRAKG